LALYGIQRIQSDNGKSDKYDTNGISKRTSYCMFKDKYIEIFLIKAISSVKIAQMIYDKILIFDCK
jgi:hypothetical protein